ncbi:basigin [Contarinia nasturtii]|uniref:basigin n=1 Tax=Contarinia nasturtii TaxID=265458 RepID=UPI0012D4BE3F|nr:basigin [Contarinia nasturtii]XP_031628141.1 basigin [Contarinia nasturtii]
MEFNKHFKLNSMLKYITVILFIVSTTVKAELQAKYTDEANKIVYFDARDKSGLVLTCKQTKSNYEIKWKKNGEDVSKVDSLKGRYAIKDNYSNFIIENTDPDDHGNYTCKIDETNEEQHIEVISAVYLKKIPNNLSVVEGERLTIHCKAYGTAPEIEWSLVGGAELNLTHVTFKEDEENVKNAILIIEHAELEDRNNYTCTARNKAVGIKLKDAQGVTKILTEESEHTFVRVKGKLAALWPFLGICAEVFILCAIILVYEKRRNKEGLDESDTDQSPEQEKLKTGK